MRKRSLIVLSLLSSPLLADDVAAPDTLVEITVLAKRIANTTPANAFASAATALRFDPLTELQSRGLAEGQSDVVVRGGVFENTGFKVGAVTIIDPQTGHYGAELPIDPALLSAPAIYKGIDNAVAGFNAAVATVAYRILPISSGGRLSLAVGNDKLRAQNLQIAHTNESGLGFAATAARSAGDGTLPFGDHEFERYNVQLQLNNDGVQSDLILSFQDKFYGWPGAYTGFATLPETDDTQTTLVLLSQHREMERGWLEVSGYYRRLVNDYDFNRLDFETGVAGSFEHETKAMAIGVDGEIQTGSITWRYSSQVSKDELVKSTDLTNGFFNERNSATLSIVPSLNMTTQSGKLLTWRAGFTADYSNRDSNRGSPLLGVSVAESDPGGTTVWSLEYAATSQLPGYTALNSNPVGLFGGNPNLDRETARQLALTWERQSQRLHARATLFSRLDDDLVDWTYSDSTPFARQARPVDIDLLGVETFVTYSWDRIDIAAGYTFLDKAADYGDSTVDASFYALNFAKHRATLAVRYQLSRSIKLNIDNEYRWQEANPLRVGDDSSYIASASLLWNSANFDGLSSTLIVDNLTDVKFQPFPGTPAAGRQFSLSVSYAW